MVQRGVIIYRETVDKFLQTWKIRAVLIVANVKSIRHTFKEKSDLLINIILLVHKIARSKAATSISKCTSEFL